MQQAIGWKAVTALAATFPGQRIYVPWAKSDALARFVDDFGPLIGTDNALTLIDQFGGLRIIVPTRAPERRAVNMQRVVELSIAQSLTAAQIAKLLKCDPRSVYYARAKAKRTGQWHHPQRRRG